LGALLEPCAHRITSHGMEGWAGSSLQVWSGWLPKVPVCDFWGAWQEAVGREGHNRDSGEAFFDAVAFGSQTTFYVNDLQTFSGRSSSLCFVLGVSFLCASPF